MDIEGGEEIPKNREGVEILPLSPVPSGTCTAGEFARPRIMVSLLQTLLPHWVHTGNHADREETSDHLRDTIT